ncbi:MAG: sialate O-acetylesterase [Verrucomicrobiota bacterium]
MSDISDPLPPAGSGAAFGLSSLFSPGVVFQRHAPICIWGWGVEGATIQVALGGASGDAHVKDGVWEAILPARKEGGPFTLDIRCGDQELSIEGVLVGEVILCSGQSNMEVPVSTLSTRDEILPHAQNDRVRVFVQDIQPVPVPARDVRNGRWVAATSEEAPDIPALPLMFGLRLQKALGVPVGILAAAVGGTGITSWLPQSVFGKYEDLKNYWSAYPWNLDDEAAVYSKWVSDRAAQDTENARRAASGEAPLPWNKYLFFGPRGPRCKAQPAGLYNGEIHPLARFRINGVAWYQGETDAEEPSHYQRHLKELIAAWRAAWNLPELRFFIVQIVRYALEATSENWPAIREAQSIVADQTDGTFLVPGIDFGDPQDTHPADKDLLAARLSRFVHLSITGADVPQAPRITRMERAGDGSFRCTFSQPVRVAGDGVSGFELAGADGIFRKASARLSSPCTAVIEAKAEDEELRYLWRGAPDVNVFSEDGLPPLPFRTDAAPAPVQVEQHYLSSWPNGPG